MTQFNNNFWDERYSAEEYVYGKDPNEFFEEHLSKLNPGRLLLPGEGEGRNAIFAAKLGWQVDATDQSIVAQSKAEKLANAYGVKINYTVCDINIYIFNENYYDAAALIFFHLPIEIRSEIHKKILNSLKSEGTLIFEMFNKGQLDRETGGPQNYDMLYSTEDFKRDFGSLKTILLENKIITLNEGPKHSGEASVIRYIGKKE